MAAERLPVCAPSGPKWEGFCPVSWKRGQQEQLHLLSLSGTGVIATRRHGPSQSTRAFPQIGASNTAVRMPLARGPGAPQATTNARQPWSPKLLIAQPSSQHTSRQWCAEDAPVSPSCHQDLPIGAEPVELRSKPVLFATQRQAPLATDPDLVHRLKQRGIPQPQIFHQSRRRYGTVHYAAQLLQPQQHPLPQPGSRHGPQWLHHRPLLI
mmetsp:Transcript_28113/g.65320  ORF Transcript_28113/g.65320 Transcript_28113/m.65320 type:complete len:210 (+) Transcript_28113:2505-3134(+)